MNFLENKELHKELYNLQNELYNEPYNLQHERYIEKPTGAQQSLGTKMNFTKWCFAYKTTKRQ